MKQRYILLWLALLTIANTLVMADSYLTMKKIYHNMELLTDCQLRLTESFCKYLDIK